MAWGRGAGKRNKQREIRAWPWQRALFRAPGTKHSKIDILVCKIGV